MKNKEVKAVGCQSSFSVLNSQFLILCVSISFCSVATADSLRFKFAPGDKYSLVSVTEQKISRTTDGNEWSAEQTTHLESDLAVEEVDENGVAWARYTHKRVIMKLRSKGQQVEFDSDANQPKIPIQAMPLHLALGESIYLQITPQGHIERINGLQSLTTYAKGKIGDFPGGEMVSREIDRQFAEPAAKRTLEDQLAVFPDSNNEGATWTRKEVLFSADLSYAKADQIGEVNIVFDKTFRLNIDKSGSGGISVADVNLIIQPEVVSAQNARRAASQSEATGVISTKASREISGEGTGQIEIENATGRIISSKMTQDMVERVKLATQGQMLRPTSGPEPVITHKVTTFQMTKITEGKSAQPADANEKTEKGV